MHAVQSVPGQGLFVDLDVFDEIRIAGGDKTLWTDEANRDNLLFGEQSPLKPFFARFVRKDDKAAVFEMRRNGREIASTSVPINPTRGIPAALKQELQEAFENFRAMGNDSKATEEARLFIESLRLADPTDSPEMYRVFREGRKDRVLVLWGCTRKGAAQLRPLDAITRLPTRPAASWLLRIAAVIIGISMLVGAVILAIMLWPVAPPVIATVTDPITFASQQATTAQGSGKAGANISVVASDGTQSTKPSTAAVAADGTWSATVDVGTLSDGTITYTATASNAAGKLSAPTSLTAIKDTVPPTLDLTSVTSPINMKNLHATTAQGTGKAGANISVVASEGTHSTKPSTAVVAADETWSATVDVGTLSDGTITYSATASDAAGNSSPPTTLTAIKDTAPPALTIASVTSEASAANPDAMIASGTGEAGANIAVAASDSTHTVNPNTTKVAPDGTWSLTVDAGTLNDGMVTYTAIASDAAGNSSPPSSLTVTKGLAPYLDVQPRAVVVGGLAKITVKADGRFTASDSRGNPVKDKETKLAMKNIKINAGDLKPWRPQSPGVRFVEWVPDDKQLKPEKIVIAVYDAPSVDDHKVTITVPEEVFTDNLRIDWGDGTTIDSPSREASHEYPDEGEYSIKLLPSDHDPDLGMDLIVRVGGTNASPERANASRRVFELKKTSDELIDDHKVRFTLVVREK